MHHPTRRPSTRDIGLSMVCLAALLLALALIAAAPARAAECFDAITVTNANDSGSGSLRQTVADVCAGGTITFAASYSIYLESGLSLDGTVMIDGSGQSVTISGDSGNDGSRNVRPFTIAATGVVTLSHLTIVDSAATEGGAINTSGQLTVRASSFARNQAGASGGAIFSGGGTLTVE